MLNLPPTLADLRRSYHRALCQDILGHRPNSTIFSNADGSSATSIDLAARIAAKIGEPFCTTPPAGQTAGTLFGQHTMEFIRATFGRLSHLRPGAWFYSTSQFGTGIAAFDQYKHLADLARLLSTNRELKAALGSEYLITPDIIVARQPIDDDAINAPNMLLDPHTPFAAHMPLRASNYLRSVPLLHASISCKWTMRSDRSQNTRTEALNLIRNRKGQTPHIMVVTMEPVPSRLASLVLGTSGVDCTYHAALHELLAAVEESGRDDQEDLLQTLVMDSRLRDISDLPLDLAI